MSSKLTGLALAQRIAPTIADEYVLDRILPYLIWLLDDTSALVRSRSVQVIADMVSTAVVLMLNVHNLLTINLVEAS
jgi:hypothetical protein